MNTRGGTFVRRIGALLGGAAATGAAVAAGVPGREAVALLPGAISWGFFVRWCRRSFKTRV